MGDPRRAWDDSRPGRGIPVARPGRRRSSRPTRERAAAALGRRGWRLLRASTPFARGPNAPRQLVEGAAVGLLAVGGQASRRGSTGAARGSAAGDPRRRERGARTRSGGRQRIQGGGSTAPRGTRRRRRMASRATRRMEEAVGREQRIQAFPVTAKLAALLGHADGWWVETLSTPCPLWLRPVCRRMPCARTACRGNGERPRGPRSENVDDLGREETGEERTYPPYSERTVRGRDNGHHGRAENPAV